MRCKGEDKRWRERINNGCNSNGGDNVFVKVDDDLELILVHNIK